eukprot:m.72230 g.72230  ORF g.72230 m.72230 type:complete len:255 (-) comp12312_c0_seq1:3-767(-)
MVSEQPRNAPAHKKTPRMYILLASTVVMFVAWNHVWELDSVTTTTTTALTLTQRGNFSEPSNKIIWVNLLLNSTTNTTTTSSTTATTTTGTTLEKIPPTITISTTTSTSKDTPPTITISASTSITSKTIKIPTPRTTAFFKAANTPTTNTSLLTSISMDYALDNTTSKSLTSSFLQDAKFTRNESVGHMCLIVELDVRNIRAGYHKQQQEHTNKDYSWWGSIYKPFNGANECKTEEQQQQQQQPTTTTTPNNIQ